MYIRLFSRGVQDLDDVGVVEALPHRFFALEAFEEDDVALELRVRDLERDHGAAVLAVDGLEDRRHSAAGQQLAELVLIEPVAGHGLAHQRAPRKYMRRPYHEGPTAKGRARGAA